MYSALGDSRRLPTEYHMWAQGITMSTGSMDAIRSCHAASQLGGMVGLLSVLNISVMRLMQSSESRKGSGSKGEFHHPSCGYVLCMGPIIGLKCFDALPHRDTLSIPSTGSSKSQSVMS